MTTVPDLRLDEDRAFFDRELSSFVPDRVFDAHCHLHAPDHAEFKVKGIPDTVGYPEYLRLIDQLHPGRRVAALYLAWAIAPERITRANQWVSDNVAKTRDCRGFFFVRPTDDPEWVRQEVRRLKLHGLKCYHLQSPSKPTWESQIPDYLPEPLVKVAHEEGWGITLHMVRSRSVADPGNIHWIRRYCETYPNMKLILAHSARGFQPAHNLEGLPQLVGLDNLYFDTSANCEPIAHESIIRLFGHQRLLYGSDFCVSHQRGRPVAVGDSFLWLYEDTPVWGEKHTKIQPVFVGLEHLRSLKWACWSVKLTDAQVEDIFWNNAAKLFNIGAVPATAKPSAV